MATPIGLGIRVRTGKAIVVALEGPVRGPEVALRREITLSDPDVPGSHQPYHAGLGLERETADAIVARLAEAVHVASARSVRALVSDLKSSGSRVAKVGIVRSSDTDPATVRSPHMHAHAAEGALFYLAVAEAARGLGLEVFEALQKYVLAEAAAGLERDRADFSDAIGALGKQVGSPWRADEKVACAAAWLALGMTPMPARRD